MGKQHANQTFVDATGFSTEALTTDTNGILTVPVLGKTNPLVRGYLGVWVPAEDNKGKKLTTASRVSMHPSFHLQPTATLALKPAIKAETDTNGKKRT